MRTFEEEEKERLRHTPYLLIRELAEVTQLSRYRKKGKNRVRKEKKLDVRCVLDACTHSLIAGGISTLGGPAVHHIQKYLEGSFLKFGSNVLFRSRLK